MHFHESYVPVNGVRLHCVTAGEPSKKLVMFLHGFPEFWYQWKEQLREFGKDHFVVAPDMRGYNLSEKPAELDAYRVPALLETFADSRIISDKGRNSFWWRTIGAERWRGALRLRIRIIWKSW